jgi:hypothetical protein
MKGVAIVAAAVMVPVAAAAQSAAEPPVTVVYMNARVVAASLDGRRLTVVDTDGHSRTLPIDPHASVRVGNLRMDDEVLITVRSQEDKPVIAGVKVSGLSRAADAAPATAPAVAAPAGLSAGDYFAARRQRPNPYSLVNPMFPPGSSKNPWSRRRLATTDER